MNVTQNTVKVYARHSEVGGTHIWYIEQCTFPLN